MHVVADQEHSDCAVPRNQYRMELVWRFVMPTVCMREPLESTFMLELVLIHPYVDIHTWTLPSMHAHQGNYDMARSM